VEDLRTAAGHSKGVRSEIAECSIGEVADLPDGKRVDECLEPLPCDKPHPGLAALAIVDLERAELLGDEQPSIGARRHEANDKTVDFRLIELGMIGSGVSNRTNENPLPRPRGVECVDRPLTDCVAGETHHPEHEATCVCRIGIEPLGPYSGLDGLGQSQLRSQGWECLGRSSISKAGGILWEVGDSIEGIKSGA